ncbi:hypothetical protein GCM10023090_08210 [Acidovorax lacteus]|uniref:Glycosyltransferase n=2 Tax=Acidovorax lacteus TaxID=1924988 RepID=A0ABP8L1X4_9BURK
MLPGFWGRAPWKSADIAAFGYMQAIAENRTSWWAPTLAGLPPETEGLLPYWLGAWALRIAPESWSAEWVVRWPFLGLLALTLCATWYGVYHLARAPSAQPVAFAFGGEAPPTDYARTMADSALLALIACLGLAQLSHETTSYLSQLAFVALAFYGAAVLPQSALRGLIALSAGLPGIVLSGAPTVGLLVGLGALWMAALAPRRWTVMSCMLGLLIACAALGWSGQLFAWRTVLPGGSEGKDWESLLRLLVWFGWPAWPLALWTLWRWRTQLGAPAQYPHIALPLWFTLVGLGATLTTLPADRALLLGLPSMAALAAFALPTLRRSVAALIDWFTLLFFSVSAITIWVIWVAMQTGVPAKPAANVAKLAPGFEPQFSGVALGVALAATMAWCALVWWRAARDRAVLWKSLVLPASGATLGWLLLLTLWLPLLDFARSYQPQMQAIGALLAPQSGCVHPIGLSRSQIAAIEYHLDRTVMTPTPDADCPWALADRNLWQQMLQTDRTPVAANWSQIAVVPRPTDKTDHIVVLRRVSPR